MSPHPVIWRIARHEVVQSWRTRGLAAMGAVLTALTLSAAIVGGVRHGTESAQRDRYQQLVGAQFDEQPDRHPHRVSHYGFLVFRPRAPLGFFDSGVERFAGTSVFLEAHRQNAANFSASSQSGSSDRFGELSLALVLQFFAPLFVFVVAGLSVTREREAGTLPLLLCQGVPWSAVLAGKLVGVMLAALMVLAPGVLAAIAWLTWRSGAEMSSDLALRAAALAGAHVLFLGASAALGVAVSARSATSRQALVTLVGLWIALWVIAPRVLPVFAAALHPVPARTAFDAEVEARVMELGDSHNPDDPVFTRLKVETLERYGVSRVEDLPFNYGGLVMREGEALTTRAYREHLDRLLEVYRTQGRMVEAAGAVSPYLGIRAVSMALAGSDVPHVLEFERQAEAYRFDLIQALNDLHIHEVEQAKDRYGEVDGGAPTRQRIERRFFDALPEFSYRAPDIAWSLARQATGLAALLLNAAALFLLLGRAARQPARAS